MPKVDPARLVAFEVLRAVSEKDAYANLELSRLLRESRLTGRDAALATELVGGTLRLQGSYDDILNRDTRPVPDFLRQGPTPDIGLEPVPAATTLESSVRRRK